MMPGRSVPSGPPLGKGFQSSRVIGNLEKFSAFGVGGWVVPTDPSAGRLTLHVVTGASFDVGEVSLPRPDVVMTGHSQLFSGFDFTLENWLRLGRSADAPAERISLIFVQGETPCHRLDFTMPTAELLVPQVHCNVEVSARTHMAGWLVSADRSAPFSLLAVNEHGEEFAIPADIQRADLIANDPTARAFWSELPLRFTLRQRGVKLFAVQRDRRFEVADLRLPDIVAFLELDVEQQLNAGERPATLRGWAVNMYRPGLRPKISLVSEGISLWSTRAAFYRPDIAEQAGMDGFCAFAVPLGVVPDEADWSLVVGEGADARVLASGKGQ